MNTNNIVNAIEATLFYKGEPIQIKKLVEMLGVKESEVRAGLVALREQLAGRGVALMEHADSVMLATAPSVSSLIEQIVKDELSRDLGKAGLETLSIIVYLGPISRSRVDWIRGVNATFILRNLMARGLIERIQNPDDERAFLYRPTLELLAHLGVSRVEELPDYEQVRAEIQSFEARSAEAVKEEELDGGEHTE